MGIYIADLSFTVLLAHCHLHIHINLSGLMVGAKTWGTLGENPRALPFVVVVIMLAVCLCGCIVCRKTELIMYIRVYMCV